MRASATTCRDHGDGDEGRDVEDIVRFWSDRFIIRLEPSKLGLDEGLIFIDVPNICKEQRK